MSAPVTSNDILSLVELALQEKIQTAVYDWAIPVYLTDEDALKGPMPYIVIHADNYEEQIGPGSGIFKVRVTTKLRSHTKVDDENKRVSVIMTLNNFAYSNAAIELSGENLHVYGFIPGASGEVQVNPDLKCYEYLTVWDLFCMPRPNE